MLAGTKKRNLPIWITVGFSVLFGIILILCSTILKEWNYSLLITSVLDALGQVFLISSVLAAISDVTLRERMMTDFSARTEIILRGFFDTTFKSSMKYGFEGIADELDVGELIDSMDPGDRLLWLDTYSPGHVQWLDIVEKKAREGALFKFMILEPGSPMAEMRRREIGGRFEYAFDNELSIFLEDICALARRVNRELEHERVEVRTYSDLLAIPFYVVERASRPDIAVTSFYLRRATAVAFPHLEWRESAGGFVRVLNEYFHWKWGNSKSQVGSGGGALPTAVVSTPVFSPPLAPPTAPKEPSV